MTPRSVSASWTLCMALRKDLLANDLAYETPDPLCTQIRKAAGRAKKEEKMKRRVIGLQIDTPHTFSFCSVIVKPLGGQILSRSATLISHWHQL